MRSVVFAAVSRSGNANLIRFRNLRCSFVARTNSATTSHSAKMRMQQQHQETFQASMAKVIFMAQLFALLPPACNWLVAGKRKQRTWRSFCMCSASLYGVVIFILNGLEFLTVVNLLLTEGLNFHNSGTVSFYVVCLLERVFFWLLAIKWPSIMLTWSRVERIFLRVPYEQYTRGYNMCRRIYTCTMFVMLAAFVEHMLLLSNSFHNSELERTQCRLNVSYWESIYRRERYHLSLVVPFRIWLLPVFEWINLTLAFARSFTDAFIMCISIGLTALYRQLLLRIRAVHTKTLPGIFWTETRQHYLLLQQLLRELNQKMAVLIVLACSNNMYFICFQLFNSFQNIGVDVMAVLAFWYSLVFAVVRSVATLYIASQLHDHSQWLLDTLRDVPSRSWCKEVQRFAEHLTVEVTALSGHGFFFLTRKLILAMGSTIVTYELMVAGVINQGAIRQRTQYC